MRKYLQITFVLGIFFLIVLVKDIKGKDEREDIARKPLPTPAPTVISASPSPSGTALSPSPTPAQILTGKYKDGTYDGTVEDAIYGNLQVQVIIRGGKIFDVLPLLYPNDNRTSILINTQAFPMLRDNAIRKQRAQVDIISGASDSSPAFSRSLASALRRAS